MVSSAMGSYHTVLIDSHGAMAIICIVLGGGSQGFS